jgi:hypothetical protein
MTSRSCRRRVGLPWTLWGLEALFRRCPHFFLEGVLRDLALSFVAQFVVIWLITYQTEGSVRS